MLLVLVPLEKEELYSRPSSLPIKERQLTLDGTYDEHSYSEFDAALVLEKAEESMGLMYSCINLLFMILSNGCVDDDKKGDIRRKLLFSTMYDLRLCSFSA